MVADFATVPLYLKNPAAMIDALDEDAPEISRRYQLNNGALLVVLNVGRQVGG